MSGVAPIVIGAVAGVVCCYAVKLKTKAGYDDALDVVGVHFVGGLVGSLLIGLLRQPRVLRTGDFKEGLFYGGGLQPARRAGCSPTSSAIVWSFVVTFVIMLVLKSDDRRPRVGDETEATGLDLAEHAETAYH